jgi:adenylate cyclase
MSRGLASFQKYMPTELVRTLVSQGVEARPGGHRQTLTVMFTDVAGFTGISEELGSRVVPVLAEYLEAVSTAVSKYRGTIDKFIGAGVMALWGAPVPSERHAVDACAAALECQRLLGLQRAEADHCRWNSAAYPRRYQHRPYAGREHRFERAAELYFIGDPVNVASRLEALGKIYGVHIIIGEETRTAAGDAIIVRRLDWVAVYGPIGGLAIYELFGMVEDPGAEIPQWVETYEAGLAAYGDRSWPEAVRLFEAVAARRGGLDHPSKSLLDVVAPASPIHRPTNGRRFRCGNRSDLRIPVLSEADILGALPALQKYARKLTRGVLMPTVRITPRLIGALSIWGKWSLSIWPPLPRRSSA